MCSGPGYGGEGNGGMGCNVGLHWRLRAVDAGTSSFVFICGE